MINVDFVNSVEISLPAQLTAGVPTGTLLAGRAVEMTSTGVAAPAATAANRVLGLVKENYIAGVVNEVTGQYGVGGSARVTVVMHGYVTVQQSSYNGISYNVYDQTQTYVIGQDLYSTPSTGVLTNQTQAGAGPNGLTSIRVGRVLSLPTIAGNGDPMQISVECA